MKKILVFGSLALITASVLSIGVVFAAGSSTATPIPFPWNISLKDLGISNPGILPSNPFYFLKEWSRSIKQVLTTDPIKKLNNDLTDMNERAAEIKKLSENPNSDPANIIAAAAKYEASAVILRSDLIALNSTAADTKTDEFLNNLIGTLLRHEEIFDQIKGQLAADADVVNSLDKAEARIESLVAVVPAKFDSPEIFKARLDGAAQSGLEGVTSTETIIFKNLRSAEVISRLGRNFSSSTKDKTDELVRDLVKRIGDGLGELNQEDRAKVLDPKTLIQLPGDNYELFNILNAVSMGSNDRSVADRIDEFRIMVLDERFQKNNITEDDIAGIIKDAENIIDEIKAAMSPSIDKSLKSQIEDFLARTQDGLAKAQKALNDGRIDEAYGFAVSGNADAEKAMNFFVAPTGTPKENNSSSTGSVNTGSTNNRIACAMEYAPVCGSDKKTYSNSCLAKAAGVSFKPGECLNSKN